MERPKSPIYAQLGELSKLPAELRIQIYKYLFTEFFDKVSTASQLSILSSSRRLQKEAVETLYRHRALGLDLRVEYLPTDKIQYSAEISLSVNETKEENMRILKKINLSGLDAAVRLIQSFPSWRFEESGPWISFDDLKLNHTDKSRILRLWEVIQTINEALKATPRGADMTFHPYNSGPWGIFVMSSWFEDQFPRHASRYKTHPPRDSVDGDRRLGPCKFLPDYYYAVLRAIKLVDDDSE